MCFKYCDSFPTLFSLLDDRYDGDVHRMSPDDVRAVMEPCFQCKLCEVQCPYTPRDGHEFQLDIPKLFHRYRAVTKKGARRSLRQRVLGDPDLRTRLSTGAHEHASRYTWAATALGTLEVLAREAIRRRGRP